MCLYTVITINLWVLSVYAIAKYYTIVIHSNHTILTDP